MKTGDAIAEILKREGVELLIGYPVNHILEHAAAADIRPIIVRQERIGLHMADAIVARHLRQEDRRVLHAARPRRRERLRRRRPGLRRIGADPGDARWAMPRRIAYVPPQLQLAVSMTRHHQVGRAGHARPRSCRTSCAAPSRSCATAAAARCWSRCPTDVFAEEVPDPLDYAPVRSARIGPDPDAVTRGGARCWSRPSGPVIYAGQGVHWAEAWRELQGAGRAAGDARSRTSLEGKSAFPETHPLSLGSGGLAIPQPVRTLPRRVPT